MKPSCKLVMLRESCFSESRMFAVSAVPSLVVKCHQRMDCMLSSYSYKVTTTCRNPCACRRHPLIVLFTGMKYIHGTANVHLCCTGFVVSLVLRNLIVG